MNDSDLAMMIAYWRTIADCPHNDYVHQGLLEACDILECYLKGRPE